jgi:hypothetical protein
MCTFHKSLGGRSGRVPVIYNVYNYFITIIIHVIIMYVIIMYVIIMYVIIMYDNNIHDNFKNLKKVSFKTGAITSIHDMSKSCLLK